jgi:F-box protein, helicase, 18
MQLTPEQQAIINTNHHLVINAVAGSGKTTTLVAYAQSRPVGKRILYLAFNKTVKTEAIKKMEEAGVKNITIETAHSLAFDHVVKYSSLQISPGYKSYEWCDILHIATGDRPTDYMIANHVNRFISYFCNSIAARVTDLTYTETVSDEKAKTFAGNFYGQIEKFTREALAKMNSGEIAMTHDFYLKKFQLSNPVLAYDYILFDEGQDASPAMLDVFLKQAAIKVIVGDVHQQIYGWRHAVNSLQQVDFPVYYLSHSFRFDDEVALAANKFLSWKNHLQLPPTVKLTGAATPNNNISTKATLGRSNLSLLLNAVARWESGEIKSVHFEGNINSYTFADEGASLYDVLNLHNGKAHLIKDKLIASMRNMKELEDYIEKTEDNSLAIIKDVVKELGNRLPGLIAELKNNHTANKEDADMIFSTVHRCKGMEYDEVTLLNDFINLQKLLKRIAEAGADKLTPMHKNRMAEEINLLYVAATRAKKRLYLPEDLNPFTTVQIKENTTTPQQYRSNSRSNTDWDVYAKSYNRQAAKNNPTNRTSNHGKHWTYEEEEMLEEMYRNGNSLAAIAKALERGEKGVRIKMINLDLISEDEVF